MNKKILIILFVALLLLAFGCKGPQETEYVGDEKYESIEIRSNEGVTEITQGDTNSWCQKGANWDYEGNDGSSAEFIITGLEEYKEKNMCRAHYKSANNNETSEAFYYFTEDNKYVYMLIKKDGNIIAEEEILAETQINS